MKIYDIYAVSTYIYDKYAAAFVNKPSGKYSALYFIWRSSYYILFLWSHLPIFYL